MADLKKIAHTSFNDENLYKLRHSMAHVLAEAVVGLMPTAKLAIGPPIEHGFYYDFELPRALTQSDLAELEEKMRAIIKGAHRFVQRDLTRREALERFADQPYKCELIHDLDTEPLGTYTQHTFTDLCKGPHVSNTGELSATGFKLLSIAGAYWRGDEKRPMLQRIYGTAWNSAKELRVYLELLKQIEARDHRTLGRTLDLFSIHEEAGSGLIYWHPRGARIRLAIEDYWRARHLDNGYELLYTPHVGKGWLWERSGHLDFYRENMFAAMKLDNVDYYAKPMNCPFHIMIYQTTNRSYRDLPLRWAELGTVYRYERSGSLHGLLRVRGFTQDDAHIFCAPEQAVDEIVEVLRFSLSVWKDFGFEDIHAFLATQPTKSVGASADWRRAEAALEQALQHQNIDYTVEKEGGAFYGPKIDIKIKDALGRSWQMSTIQFDFNLPERFGMEYVGSDGAPHRPFMIHRALLGSLERFMGVLIEHYGGAFPLWLAPEQLRIIPVAPPFADYAKEVAAHMCTGAIRATADTSTERLNAKIRLARVLKIPYLAVVGEREMRDSTLTLKRYGRDTNENLPLAAALQRLTDESARRGAEDSKD